MDVNAKIGIEGIELGINNLGWPKPLVDVFERWTQRRQIANQIGIIKTTAYELEALMQEGGLNDQRLVVATAMTMAGVNVRELENLLHTLNKTADQLSNTDEQHMTEPSTNFMHRWADATKVAGEDELREMFASILAGEMRDPGSVSYHTIEITKGLDPKTAELFRKCASVSMGLGKALFLCTLGEDPNMDGLQWLGFNYSSLCILRELGLLGSDFEGGYHFGVGGTWGSLRYAGRRWNLHRDWTVNPDDEVLRLPCIHATVAGEELAWCINMIEITHYTERLQAYLASRGLRLMPSIDSHTTS